MRVLFCGDRNWSDIEMIAEELIDLLPKDPTIIVGGAKGADSIAEGVARDLNLKVEVFKADWATYGRAAGPIRNKAMLESGIDKVLAFHDNLSMSKGTRNLVSQAKKMGIEVEVLGRGLSLEEYIHAKEKTAKKEV